MEEFESHTDEILYQVELPEDMAKFENSTNFPMKLMMN